MSKLYGALIVLSLIWGTSFLFMKILLDTLDPAVIVFGRCFFGFLILGIIYLIVKRGQRNGKKLPWVKITFVALMNNVIPWLFICSSETKISSSLASIINATTPIWTLVIGFLIFSSPLRKNQWVGIIVGFIGIFILSEIKPGDFNAGHLSGVLLMSCATFCYGVGSHLSKKFLSDLSVLETSFLTMAFSAAISLVWVLITGPGQLAELFDVSVILPFVGLGVLGSGIAYLLYYFLVQKGSPEFASLVTYLAPVSAIFWGALLLNEKIHASMMIGLAVIFAGVYISSLKVKGKMGKKAAA